MRMYTIAEARFILSHVYCVHHLPDDDGAYVYQYAAGAGEAVCSSCPCRNVADLRLYVASVRRAEAWLRTENAAIAASVQP